MTVINNPFSTFAPIVANRLGLPPAVIVVPIVVVIRVLRRNSHPDRTPKCSQLWPFANFNGKLPTVVAVDKQTKLDIGLSL